MLPDLLDGSNTDEFIKDIENMEDKFDGGPVAQFDALLDPMMNDDLLDGSNAI